MPSTPRSPPPSRCRWSSRISTARAATCRSSSTTCASGKAEVICGQGPAPAGATIAHYREPRPRHGAGHRAARRLRARHVRHLDAAAARLRHHAARRRAGARDRLRRATAIRWSSAPAPPSRPSRSCSASIGRPRRRSICRAARCRRPARCSPTRRSPRPMRACCARPRAPAAIAISADRARAQDLVAGLRRRGDRPLLPHAGGHGYERRAAIAACSPATTWRAGRRTSRRRSPTTTAATPSARPGPGAQGPVMLQQLALLKGFDLDGADPAERGLRPSAGRMLQARLCRPREVLRRSGLRRGADGDAAVGCLQRRARASSSTDKRLARAAPGLGRGLRRGGRSCAREDGASARAGRRAWAPASRPSAALGEVRGDTVHFDIIDQAGNMVSATPSGGWLQSSPVIPELGFCLGTRAQMFWLEEGHPAALAPGKRPRTTLSPTLALRDGEPYLAWGSPGGDQQDQWTTQLFLRHVHAGMNLQEAIDAPAWHSEHFPISFWPRTARPGVLVVEGRLPAETVAGARAPRPHRRGRRRLVRGPAHRRLARRPPPPRRRQSARHAGLRRGAVTFGYSAAARVSASAGITVCWNSASERSEAIRRAAGAASFSFRLASPRR